MALNFQPRSQQQHLRHQHQQQLEATINLKIKPIGNTSKQILNNNNNNNDSHSLHIQLLNPYPSLKHFLYLSMYYLFEEYSARFVQPSGGYNSEHRKKDRE